MNKIIIYKAYADYIKRADQIRLSYKGCYKKVEFGRFKIEVDDTTFFNFERKTIAGHDFTGCDVVLLGKFSEEEVSFIKCRKPKTLTYREINDFNSTIDSLCANQQKKD